MAKLDFRADLKLAEATLAAVEAAVIRDTDTSPRSHLGASMIGRDCERALWYSFRWADQPQHDGRQLRLFARGQREEDQIAALLRAAGITVEQVDRATGYQFVYARIGGHFCGSIDGAVHGLPESKAWHLWECKTHGKKSFDQLIQKGVKLAKPEHWTQMQCYMHWTGMERALYTAVCKDDDRLHFERVEYDKDATELAEAKAERIITSAEPPPKISDDPASFACKFCDFHAVCHSGKAPKVNCRTCAHSTPELDGNARWSCAMHEIAELKVDEQRIGCEHHRYIPQLLGFAKPVDADPEANTVTYALTDGSEFVNGPAPEGFTSKEIEHAHERAALVDPEVMELRRDYGARIIPCP